jgi:hypothetical protein
VHEQQGEPEPRAPGVGQTIVRSDTRADRELGAPGLEGAVGRREAFGVVGDPGQQLGEGTKAIDRPVPPRADQDLVLREIGPGEAPNWSPTSPTTRTFLHTG